MAKTVSHLPWPGLNPQTPVAYCGQLHVVAAREIVLEKSSDSVGEVSVFLLTSRSKSESGTGSQTHRIHVWYPLVN